MTSYMNYCRCRDTYLQIMSPGRLWLCSGHDLLLPPHSGAVEPGDFTKKLGISPAKS